MDFEPTPNPDPAQPFARRRAACLDSADPVAHWRGHLPVSAYYPCAGQDWHPVQGMADVDTWLYADYAPWGREDARGPLQAWLAAPPEGLELERLIEDVPPAALSPWAPWPYHPGEAGLGLTDPARWGRNGRIPVCLAPHPVAMLARYRRRDGRPVTLVYVIGEATATFLAVYGREPFTPWLLCLISMGYGLGGGWNRFFDGGDAGCTLRHALRAHPGGIPPLILSNGYLPPDEFPVCHRSPHGFHPQAGLDLRRTHDRYRPQVPDLALLRELFPAFTGAHC